MPITSLDDLHPAPYNPRKITKKAAAALAKSLGDFGDISGITWNQRTGNLVCGHQRVDQLRKAGAQLVGDALELGGKRFPIRVVDWTEKREQAANVVANSEKLSGEFTKEGLRDLLPDIHIDLGEDDFLDLRLNELGVDVLDSGSDYQSPYSDEFWAEAFADFATGKHPADLWALDLPEQIRQIQKLSEGRESAYHVPDAYFRHRFECLCGASKRTLADAMQDRAFVLGAAKLSGKYGNRTTSNVLHVASVYHGMQIARNFPPKTALDLYRANAPASGRVLDPCAGWGGRLIGWHASGVEGEYFGVDASSDTVASFDSMIKTLEIRNASVRHAAFEDIELPGEFDFVFTSPPYFDVEKYSDDEEQSFARYASFEDWVSGFLQPMVRKVRRHLRTGGRFVVNVSDAGDRSIASEVVRCAQENGFVAVSSRQFSITSSPQEGNFSNGAFEDLVTLEAV